MKNLQIYVLALILMLTAYCAQSDTPRIICFGDSLTEGPNIRAGEKFPAVLQKILHDKGYRYDVVNAGISGETAADGLRRIDSVLREGADILILEFGTNDAYTNVPSDVIRENLDAIIQRAKKHNIQVVLAGITLPPGALPHYDNQLKALYEELAEQHEVLLIPDFMKEVRASPSAMRRDGVHYKPEGAKILAEFVFEQIEPILKK